MNKNRIANRQVICNVLMQRAEQDPSLVVLCSDSRGSASLTPFAEKYPSRFVEAGIAEQDLALRGPGDFFGSRQHGLPLLKVASLQMDLETLRDAQQAAAAVIQTADSLNAPELAPLKARVEALFTRQEVSLN